MSFNDNIQLDTFNCKVQNGHHFPFQIGSSVEVSNSETKQLAMVGASKDTHAAQAHGDTRALMLHYDPKAAYTKVFVAEPNELTMQVEGIVEEQSKPLALIKMVDEDKTVLFANGYACDGTYNVVQMTPRQTLMHFENENDSSQNRTLVFGPNGIQLVAGRKVVWGIDMDGKPIETGTRFDFEAGEARKSGKKKKGKRKKQFSSKKHLAKGLLKEKKGKKGKGKKKKKGKKK